MEEIKDIVNTIVRGCAQGGVIVKDVLAAFVARTIVEKNTDTFALDKKLTTEAIDEIIVSSIEKLLESDNPAIETMKMQVEFDTSFLDEDNAVQKLLRSRSKIIASHKIAIIDVVMEDANDFETLMMLYRKIFRFLLEFTPGTRDRAVEREVAAALESVFPRIGLKAFVQLSSEEKNVQLMELARIVFGIRLFNRDQGRGGEGIENLYEDSDKVTHSIEKMLFQEVETFTESCNKYQFAIVQSNRHNRKLEKEEMESQAAQAKTYSKVDNKDDLQTKGGLQLTKSKFVSTYLLDRWSQELSNRRQYLGFLRSIQEDILMSRQKISQFRENIRNELGNLRGLVGNRSSVPKEQVYPKFDSLASTWLALWEEFLNVKARGNTLQTLTQFKNSFSPTLTDTALLTLREINHSTKESEEKKSNAANPKESVDTNRSWAEAVEDLEVDDEIELDDHATSGATLLSVNNTPDFMLLPLELQGYCPWTIVNCRGLLVPGKPSLGVVRYENMYYVCDNAAAIKEFMEHPETHLDKIRERVVANPEYIHLLRLQQQFPTASIARLLERQDFDQRAGGKPITKDAATETPTHFVERFVDVNYHWNEWELRRRALKIVNLKQCITVGQQTDNSHFRRDNDSQVYLPKDKDTQTRRSKGTNPPIKTTYIAGLRGTLSDDAVAVSKYIPKDKENRTKAQVVTLTLDL